MLPRFYTFWAINAALDQPRLRRQLNQFRETGFDGVVWHPRFYPNDPPYLSDHYLSEISDIILHAKSLGLAFWIYDEDGWPSGTVGGRLLKKYPTVVQRWAELLPAEAATPNPGAAVNAGFSTAVDPGLIATFENKEHRWSLIERSGKGVDYFNPELVRHFIELTHERYRTGLKPEAWEYVEAIFCDEPEFGLGHAYDSLSKHGAIPWTPKLPDLFRSRYGEDLLPLVQYLFFESDTGSPRCERSDAPYGEIRVKFWELLTDVFNESFTARINDWCKRHGKLLTAHVKGEEHPLFQVPTNGSCHQFFRNVSLPGIDALERYPSNNFYPRQVSSAARQFGTGRCMVEAFGGAGWGATPEDLERYLLWLGGHGLTDFVMHLSQYRLDSAAMHDWPPSQPLHVTWRDIYPDVLKRVRRELETNPRSDANMLVIAPNRGIMAHYDPREFLQTNVHNAAIYPDSVAGRINRRFIEQIEKLHQVGVNFDVSDERSLEQFGKVTNDRLLLGKCEYCGVIVPEGCQLSESARTMIGPLAASWNSRFSVPPDKLKPELQPAVATIPLSWKLETHPLNLLYLEPVMQADGWFVANFSCTDELCARHTAVKRLTSLEIVFFDDIEEASLNGVTLRFESDALKGGDSSRACLNSVTIHESNTLRFRVSASEVKQPFVWVRGLFRAMSATPFVSGPNSTVRTQGPFILSPARDAIQNDLIYDGFPFLRSSLRLTTRITISKKISRLLVEGGEADAMGLTFDAKNHRVTWRINGEFAFDVELAAGTHQLDFEFVPNTFNAFGPHHYYGGDWHIVSPDQVKGIRNFADPSDAPECTHVKEWHFRRFSLPETISIR